MMNQSERTGTTLGGRRGIRQRPICILSTAEYAETFTMSMSTFCAGLILLFGATDLKCPSPVPRAKSSMRKRATRVNDKARSVSTGQAVRIRID
jgi:hypothetical protein